MNVTARKSWVGAVQVMALVLCIVSAVWVVAWALGPNGLGLVPLYSLGDAVGESDANTDRYVEVIVDGEAGLQTARAANEIAGGFYDTTHGTEGSEFFGNGSNLMFSPNIPWSQKALWTATRVLPLAGLSAIWWLVFLALGEIRRGEGFTAQVSRKIIVIGVLVALGSPVSQYLRWVAADWLVESSTAGDIASAVPLSIDLSLVAMGLVIIAVGAAWQEAARMRRDLDGLV